MELNAQANIVQQVQKKGIRPPSALPAKLQMSIKNDIRQGFATQTKGQIVEVLAPKYGVAKRTIYKYIDKTIKEDLKEINRENLIVEMLANRQFRKRQLLSLYSKILQKEERTKDELYPYEAPLNAKLVLLKYLAEEDKILIDVLQKLNCLDKPVNQSENPWMGNILQHIQENLERQGIILVKESQT